MPPTDIPFPDPPERALRQLATAREAAAAGDATAVRALAGPLLGYPALHAEALFLLLDSARRSGDANAALAYAGRAARIAPKSPPAQGLYAMALCEAGRHEAALAAAYAARALNPDELSANGAACLAALRLGRPGAALEAARTLRAAAQCPPDAAALADALLAAAAQSSADAPTPSDLPSSGDDAPAACVRGAVRCDARGRIAGFLCDDAAPDRQLTVLLQDDRGTRLTVPAKDHTPADAAPDQTGGDHAFAVAWPHAADVVCARVTATCAQTGEPLAGSPLPVPNVPLAVEALAQLAGWLRLAALSPDAPPPLPAACRGPLFDLAREAVAGLIAGLETRFPEPDDDAGAPHA
jgi:hypothetical protein